MPTPPPTMLRLLEATRFSRKLRPRPGHSRNGEGGLLHHNLVAALDTR